jgi:hypothetical protein
MSKNELTRPILVETTDNPMFSVCAKCNQPHIHESQDKCPTCGHFLGMAVVPHSFADQTYHVGNDATHTISGTGLTVKPFITYSCTFLSKLGCVIQGDGPVFITSVDGQADAVIVDCKILEREGDPDKVEKLLAYGIQPAIGDIIIVIESMHVAHIGQDQVIVCIVQVLPHV